MSACIPPKKNPQRKWSHLRDAHLVRGERARLVGADDVRAAEGLNRGQRAHDCVLLGHLLRPEREAGRDHDRESLGNRCDRERDRNLSSFSSGYLVTYPKVVEDEDAP